MRAVIFGTMKGMRSGEYMIAQDLRSSTCLEGSAIS